MKRIAAAILALGGPVFAQSDEPILTLKRDAAMTAAAWNDGSYQALISHLAKRYFKSEGTQEQAAAELRKEIEDMKRAFGIESVTVTIEDPKQVTKADLLWWSLVPMLATVNAKGEVMVFRTFALGISTDKGLHWSFVLCYQQSQETMLALYPELKGQVTYADTYLLRREDPKPNKVLEPTPASVTPPAAQEARRP